MGDDELKAACRLLTDRTGAVTLSQTQARSVAAELELLEGIRARASSELARREGQWSGPSGVLICMAIRWVAFGCAWPTSAGGPDPRAPRSVSTP